MIEEEVLRIMTWIEIVLKALLIIFGFVIAVITIYPSLKKAIEKRKAAETAEEKAKADLEIQLALENGVAIVEQSYKTLDEALKSLGSSAGLFKKDKVLADLRDFCDEKGYAYDKEYLSAQIDEFVKKTKVVNTKMSNE